jgi:hypothetical protein
MVTEQTAKSYLCILLHVDVGKDIEVKLKEMALPQKLKVSPVFCDL